MSTMRPFSWSLALEAKLMKCMDAELPKELDGLSFLAFMQDPTCNPKKTLRFISRCWDRVTAKFKNETGLKNVTDSQIRWKWKRILLQQEQDDMRQMLDALDNDYVDDEDEDDAFENGAAVESWSQNLSSCRTTAEELQNRMNKNRPTQPPSSSGPIDSIWNLRLEAALLQCMDAHHSLGLNEEKTAGRPEEELCSSLLKLLDDEDNVDTLTINRFWNRVTDEFHKLTGRTDINVDRLQKKWMRIQSSSRRELNVHQNRKCNQFSSEGSRIWTLSLEAKLLKAMAVEEDEDEISLVELYQDQTFVRRDKSRLINSLWDKATERFRQESGLEDINKESLMEKFKNINYLTKMGLSSTRYVGEEAGISNEEDLSSQRQIEADNIQNKNVCWTKELVAKLLDCMKIKHGPDQISLLQRYQDPNYDIKKKPQLLHRHWEEAAKKFYVETGEAGITVEKLKEKWRRVLRKSKHNLPPGFEFRMPNEDQADMDQGQPHTDSEIGQFSNSDVDIQGWENSITYDQKLFYWNQHLEAKFLECMDMKDGEDQISLRSLYEDQNYDIKKQPRLNKRLWEAVLSKFREITGENEVTVDNLKNKWRRIQKLKKGQISRPSVRSTRRPILDQADEAETDQEFSQNEPDKNFDQFSSDVGCDSLDPEHCYKTGQRSFYWTAQLEKQLLECMDMKQGDDQFSLRSLYEDPNYDIKKQPRLNKRLWENVLAKFREVTGESETTPENLKGKWKRMLLQKKNTQSSGHRFRRKKIELSDIQSDPETVQSDVGQLSLSCDFPVHGQWFEWTHELETKLVECMNRRHGKGKISLLGLNLDPDYNFQNPRVYQRLWEKVAADFRLCTGLSDVKTAQLSEKWKRMKAKTKKEGEDLFQVVQAFVSNINLPEGGVNEGEDGEFKDTNASASDAYFADVVEEQGEIVDETNNEEIDSPYVDHVKGNEDSLTKVDESKIEQLKEELVSNLDEDKKVTDKLTKVNYNKIRDEEPMSEEHAYSTSPVDVMEYTVIENDEEYDESGTSSDEDCRPPRAKASSRTERQGKFVWDLNLEAKLLQCLDKAICGDSNSSFLDILSGDKINLYKNPLFLKRCWQKVERIFRQETGITNVNYFVLKEKWKRIKKLRKQETENEGNFLEDWESKRTLKTESDAGIEDFLLRMKVGNEDIESQIEKALFRLQAEEDGSNLKARDLVDSHGEEQSDPDILGQLEAATRFGDELLRINHEQNDLIDAARMECEELKKENVLLKDEVEKLKKQLEFFQGNKIVFAPSQKSLPHPDAPDDDQESGKEKGNYSFNCFVCHKFWDSKGELRSHMKQRHKTADGSQWKFNLCPYTDSTKAQLGAHIKFKHNAGHLKCDYCSYIATSKTRRKEHVHYRHRGMRLRCNHCPFTAIWRNNVVKHTMREHPGQPADRMMQLEVVSADNPVPGVQGNVTEDVASQRTQAQKKQKMVKSEYCVEDDQSDYMPSREEIPGKKRKLEAKGVRDTTSVDQPSKKVKTESVTKKTSSQKMRTASEEENKTCNICDRAFKSVFLLNEHVRISHERLRLKCDHCEFKSPLTRAMQRHFKQSHPGLAYEISYLESQADDKESPPDDYEDAGSEDNDCNNDTEEIQPYHLSTKTSSQTLHKCSKCTFVAPSARTLSKHERSVHNSALKIRGKSLKQLFSDSESEYDPENDAEEVNDGRGKEEHAGQVSNTGGSSVKPSSSHIVFRPVKINVGNLCSPEPHVKRGSPGKKLVYNCFKCRFKTAHLLILKHHLLEEHSKMRMPAQKDPLTLGQIANDEESVDKSTDREALFSGYKDINAGKIETDYEEDLSDLLEQDHLEVVTVKTEPSTKRPNTQPATEAHWTTDDENDLLPCGICKFMTTGKTNLKMHTKQQHREHRTFNRYTCLTCKKFTGKLCSLRKHIRVIHIGLLSEKKVIQPSGHKIRKNKIELCDVESDTETEPDVDHGKKALNDIGSDTDPLQLRSDLGGNLQSDLQAEESPPRRQSLLWSQEMEAKLIECMSTRHGKGKISLLGLYQDPNYDIRKNPRINKRLWEKVTADFRSCTGLSGIKGMQLSDKWKRMRQKNKKQSEEEGFERKPLRFPHQSRKTSERKTKARSQVAPQPSDNLVEKKQEIPEVQVDHRCNNCDLLFQSKLILDMHTCTPSPHLVLQARLTAQVDPLTPVSTIADSTTKTEGLVEQIEANKQGNHILAELVSSIDIEPKTELIDDTIFVSTIGGEGSSAIGASDIGHEVLIPCSSDTSVTSDGGGQSVQVAGGGKVLVKSAVGHGLFVQSGAGLNAMESAMSVTCVTCERCNYTAASLESLKQHELTSHTTGYQCNWCSSRFRVSAELKKHTELVHEGAYLQCEKCDFKTAWAGYLVKHVREMH